MARAIGALRLFDLVLQMRLHIQRTHVRRAWCPTKCGSVDPDACGEHCAARVHIQWFTL